MTMFSNLLFHHLFWGTGLFLVIWSLVKLTGLDARAKYGIWMAALVVQLTLPAVLLLPSPLAGDSKITSPQVQPLRSPQPVASSAAPDPVVSPTNPIAPDQLAVVASVEPANEMSNPVQPPQPSAEDPAEPEPAGDFHPAPEAAPGAPSPATPAALPAAVRPAPSEDNAVVAPFSGTILGVAQGSIQFISRWSAWILGFWACLSAWMLLGLGRGLLHIRRIKAGSRACDGPLADWFAQTLWERGLTRAAELRISECIATPMTAGFLRPVVLLPELVVRMLPRESLEHVILHEIAHIHRRDDWTNLLQKFAEALFFFHPAVRLTARHLDVNREMACDEWVVVQSGANRQYAFSLLKIFEFAQGGHSALPAMVGVVAGKKQLVQRVESLLSNGTNRSPRSPFPAYSLAALLFAVGYISFAVATPRLEPALTVVALADPDAQSDDRAEEKEHLRKLEIEAQRAFENQAKAMTEQRARLDAERLRMQAMLHANLDQLRAEEAEQRRKIELEFKEMREKYRAELADQHSRQMADDLIAREAELRSRLSQELDSIQKKEIEAQLAATRDQRRDMERRREAMQRHLEDAIKTQQEMLESRMAEELAEQQLTIAGEMANHQDSMTEAMAELEGQLAQEREELIARLAESQVEMQALVTEGMHEAALALEEDGRLLAEEMAERAEEMAEHRAEMAEMEAEIAAEMAEADAEMVEELEEIAVLDDDIENDHVQRKSTSRTIVHEDNLSLEMMGKVQFSEDESQVLSISRGGFLELEIPNPKPRRKFTVTTDKSGTLNYTYWLGGKKEAVGEEARSALARVLPQLLWESGLSSQSRLENMFAQMGAEGTFDQIKAISSDFAKSRYYRKLIKSGSLNEDHHIRMAADASSFESDFEKSRLYRALLQHTDSLPVTMAVMKGSKGIESSFEMKRLLTALIAEKHLNRVVPKEILDRVESIGSDFEKAGLLRQMVGSVELDAQFFDTVKSIGSDFEKSRTLTTIIRNDHERGKWLEEIIRTTASIGSDHAKTQTLLTLARSQEIPDSLRGQLEDVMRGIKSEHDRKQIERALSH